MAVLTNQVDNINFLSPLKFSFSVNKLPGVNFYVQSIVLPNVSVNPSQGMPTPFVRLPLPGDHVEFGEMQITFRIDEDMSNYIEIYNWLIAIGFPESFEQYRILASQDRRSNLNATDGILSDGTIIIHNSNANPNMQIKFINMFPTTLTDLLFDLRQTDVEYMEATASFQFERFTIEQLTS